jgi:hypothetical protein
LVKFVAKHSEQRPGEPAEQWPVSQLLHLTVSCLVLRVCCAFLGHRARIFRRPWTSVFPFVGLLVKFVAKHSEQRPGEPAEQWPVSQLLHLTVSCLVLRVCCAFFGPGG